MEMLRFALPALGIYAADPIMSNIDNGFVGKFGGTAALASLGPGTVVASNLMFIFTAILASATTGLVSRAWASPSGGASAAGAALTRTQSFSLTIGTALTLFYQLATPWALRMLNTPADILAPAASYVRIRGLVTWASLSQTVCLSAILATRDAVTPLRVVFVAAMVNFMGDCLFCCWPFRTGVAGAAAATALSVLVGFSLMLRALSQKSMMPEFRLPRRDDLGPVLEYAGPLFVITLARVIGFTCMGITAAALGTVPLAAFQVMITIFVFFAFFSGPLSQTAQTLLPPVLEVQDTAGAQRTLRNLFTIGAGLSVGVSTCCLLALRFGAMLFTDDAAVLGAIAHASLGVFLSAASLIFSSTFDGALVAAKDFGFIVPAQLSGCALQLGLLYLVRRWDLGLAGLFPTYTVRLWWFIGLAGLRVYYGGGKLGQVLQGSTAKVRS